MRRLNVPGIATTYVTGTLTSMVTGLVAGARPAEEATRSSSWWRAVRLQMLALIVYGAGGALGGVVQARWPMLCAAWPLAAVTLVVVAAPRVPRARPRATSQSHLSSQYALTVARPLEADDGRREDDRSAVRAAAAALSAP